MPLQWGSRGTESPSLIKYSIYHVIVSRKIICLCYSNSFSCRWNVPQIKSRRNSILSNLPQNARAEKVVWGADKGRGLRLLAK